MKSPGMNYDNHPDLRLVNDQDDQGGSPSNAAEERGHSELVSEVIGETGLMPPETLEQVRTRAVGGTFSQALIDEGFASALGVARTLAEQYHLPLVDLAVAGVDSEASKTIALPVLERVCAIPFASDGATLKLAITDPQNVRGLDELRLATRRPIEFYVAAKNDVLTELRRMSRAAEAQNAAFVTDAAAEADEEADEDDLEADDGISDAPLVRLVNSIIFQAAEEGASDIHVEPQEHELDRPLPDRRRPPRRAADPEAPHRRRDDPPEGSLEARHRRAAKAAGRPDHADGRRGRPPARYPGCHSADSRGRDGDDATARQVPRGADARVARALGGDAGARLGDPLAADRARCSSPGRPARASRRLSMPRSRRRAGPRSTSSRSRIRSSTGLPGSSRCRSNPRAGLTFATALRSILRSDPDVVMVGEIRDGETARISIEAALTGHLVLSTLHTNDAPSALTRLNEMGVEPFITGAAVSAVLAQRLARKLCVHCASSYEPGLDELRALHVEEEVVHALAGSTFRRKVGCARCGNTGYKGRIGVFQFLEMTGELERLASEKASREEIERAAHADGMRSLWHDGVGKVAAGITTVEELARVCTL